MTHDAQFWTFLIFQFQDFLQKCDSDSKSDSDFRLKQNHIRIDSYPRVMHHCKAHTARYPVRGTNSNKCRGCVKKLEVRTLVPSRSLCQLLWGHEKLPVRIPVYAMRMPLTQNQGDSKQDLLCLFVRWRAFRRYKSCLCWACHIPLQRSESHQLSTEQGYTIV